MSLNRVSVFYLFATALASAAVVGSLTAQFWFQLDPCPLCIGQRILYMVAATVLLAGLVNGGVAKMVAGGIGMLCGITAAGIGLYQGWIASEEALGQCGAPGPYESTLWWLAENISYPVFAPEASCADAAGHTFLGLSMPFWSLLSGLVLSLALLLFFINLGNSAKLTSS